MGSSGSNVSSPPRVLGLPKSTDQRDADAPGSEGFRDADDLRNEIGGEHARVGIDVVDGARVDAERCEEPAILADTSQIRASLQVVPEDGAPAVPALDGSIEIVPLIDPAHRGVRRLLLIELADGLAEGDFSEECKGAVEHAAIVRAGDYRVGDAAGVGGGEPVAIHREVGGEMKLPQVGERTEDDGGLLGQARFHAQSAAEHAANATE